MSGSGFSGSENTSSSRTIREQISEKTIRELTSVARVSEFLFGCVYQALKP